MNHNMVKLARLALRKSTGEAEWQAATIGFFRVLRKNKIQSEQLRIKRADQACHGLEARSLGAGAHPSTTSAEEI
jgi:hypothetical protein